MNEYDGPTLRSVRESVNVSLRRVARLSKMSHGHLSKVERDEIGRPVTPAILTAYEKATGVRLTNTTGPLPGFNEQWQQGALNEVRRRAFNAQVASIAVGGPLGTPGTQLVDSIGAYLLPEQVHDTDTSLIHHAAALATRLDLTHGGGLASQLCRANLRWALGLTRTTTANGQANTRLHAGIGHLAQRCAWSAFDAGRHDPARTLFALALDAAITADDRDLRGHILADIAAQHNHLGHHSDAITIIELTEADPRITPPVRAVLYTVKARAYAATANPDQCWRYIDLAEQTLATTSPDVEGWQATITTPGHLYATTGHATATLAHYTNRDTDRQQAIRRLTDAVEDLNPTTHTRAHILAALQLATVQLSDDPHAAIRHTVHALPFAQQMRSARITAAVNTLRATAAAHPNPAGTDLIEVIDQYRQQHGDRHRYPRTDRPRTTQAIAAPDTTPEPDTEATHDVNATNGASE